LAHRPYIHGVHRFGRACAGTSARSTSLSETRTPRAGHGRASGQRTDKRRAEQEQRRLPPRSEFGERLSELVLRVTGLLPAQLRSLGLDCQCTSNPSGKAYEESPSEN
jgi:hypothetical protein